MTKPPPTVRRIDVAAFKNSIENASEAEIERQHHDDQLRYQREYAAFESAYALEQCHLCNRSFKTLSVDRPCVHWILRRGKFKKRDLTRLFGIFGYTQFAALTRWVANQESAFRNIHDLESGKDARKLFQYTIRWKNIEWSFDCSESDYRGHGGAHSNFPHFHLQMTIDGRRFIDFGDFHIPFTEEDLARIDLAKAVPQHVNATFGEAGRGMQFTAELDPHTLIEESEMAASDDIATHRMLTMINTSDGTFDPKTLFEIIQERERTGEPIASLAKKKLPASANVETIITPAGTIPDIAKRTERSRR